MKTGIAVVLIALLFFLLMTPGCSTLPEGAKKVTVDRLYISTENGVEEIKTYPVRLVVPDECGATEVDYAYVSTETRVLESGEKVVSRTMKTIPVRKLFCPPGVMPQPGQAAEQRYQRAPPAVPYGNDMASRVCRGFGNLQGVREVFGCQ